MIDWQWMMVLGIAIGSFIAAVSSGSFRIQAVPSMWERHFGSSIALRARAAFVGGVIAMFGARLADGCPSGHGLSGSLQLAVSGYVALACFFLGGLLMAKLMEPQTAEPRDSFSDIEVYPDDKPANVIDAAALGVSNGLQLALNVGAMLLAFIALIAMLNGILGWVGNWFGFAHLSLQLILGHVFAPLAFVLGVPWSEAMTAGSFIGEKLVLNEFVAYVDFAAYLDPVQAAAKGIQVLSGPTQVIVTFALCGFANLSSIGILLGSLGVMAPSRRQDIARLGLRAVIAGTLSNLMSAALAGVFISL